MVAVGVHARQLLGLAHRLRWPDRGRPAAAADRRADPRLRDGGVERPRRAALVRAQIQTGSDRVAAAGRRLGLDRIGGGGGEGQWPEPPSAVAGTAIAASAAAAATGRERIVIRLAIAGGSVGTAMARVSRSVACAWMASVSDEELWLWLCSTSRHWNLDRADPRWTGRTAAPAAGGRRAAYFPCPARDARARAAAGDTRCRWQPAS